MRVWLGLTHLFGLPEGHHPDDLMQAALGPVLRAAWQDIVDAPMPERIARLVQELAQREPAVPSLEHPRSLTRIGVSRLNGRPDRIQRVPALPRLGPIGATRRDAGKFPLHE
jgi:hypothetical protein